MINSLKDILKKDLESLFEGMVYRGEDGEERSVRIFKNSPPVHPDGDDLKDFPYIVIQADSGSRDNIENPNEITVRFIIGVYDDSDVTAYDDTTNRAPSDPEPYTGADVRDNMIERIMNHYAARPVLDGFRAVFPMSWATPDDDLYPYFFAGISVPFRVPSVTLDEDDFV